MGSPSPDTRPHLVFLNQHYDPDLSATSVLLTDVARHLVSQGYRVSVVCSRGRYEAGKIDAPARETRDGVDVRRFWAPGLGRATKSGRIMDYLSYSLQASACLLLTRAPDAVITLTTPPLIPVLGHWVKRLRRLPHVVWSMDLHPEAEVAAGMLKGHGLLVRWLARVSSAAYRGADGVIALGPVMRERIVRRRVPAENIGIVPPWVDGGRLFPVERTNNRLASRLGVAESSFVVMYSGNAGIAHGFDVFLEAAAGLKESDYLFLFAGDGPRRREIESAARALPIENLRYVDYFQHAELAESLSLADVHLVTLRSEFAGISVPAKLYGAMAVGRPVLFVGPAESETSITVRRAQCGIVIDPAAVEDPARTVRSALEQWKNDPRERMLVGQAGREFVRQHHERVICCPMMEEGLRRWLKPVVGLPRRP